jgi:hypothetical protein
MVSPIIMATLTLTRQMSTRRPPAFAEIRVFAKASRIANSTKGNREGAEQLDDHKTQRAQIRVFQPENNGVGLPDHTKKDSKQGRGERASVERYAVFFLWQAAGGVLFGGRDIVAALHVPNLGTQSG